MAPGSSTGRWETRNGKATKPPLRASGGYASTTDPTSWSSFDEALAAARDKQLGVGFVLDHGQDGIAGIDLDGCRDPLTGVITPAATKIIHAIGSYAEVSPSGTGVKILCRVDPLPELRTHKRVIHKAATAAVRTRRSRSTRPAATSA